MEDIKKINWTEVVIFCVISFALAWLYWIPYLIKGIEGMKAFPGPYGFSNGMFAPLIAAVFMRIFISKEGLKGSLGIIRRPKYYLIALFAPIIFTGILLFFVNLTGQGVFTWAVSYTVPVFVLMLMWKSIQQIPLGIGEEYGWRGYLLPRLLPLGEIKATIILGIIWALWHLPMMVMGLNYPGANVIVSSIIFVVFVIVASFPFTWLFRASTGSVLVVTLMHITLDVFTDVLLSPRFLPGANQLFVSGAGIISTLILTALIALRYTIFKNAFEKSCESES
ncbi:MAG: CPBP family intramembrane glutamic endopeptidase [Vulcanimicrobiota bacterium]